MAITTTSNGLFNYTAPADANYDMSTVEGQNKSYQDYSSAMSDAYNKKYGVNTSPTTQPSAQTTTQAVSAPKTMPAPTSAPTDSSAVDLKAQQKAQRAAKQSAKNKATTTTATVANTSAVDGNAVNAANETIEGRINNLLGVDAYGNYSNPVVGQAVDRANAMFAGRGLLNSSAATEAAQEAAIAKAIDIAGPDAQTYFKNRRENVDWKNKFELNKQQQAFEASQLDKQLKFQATQQKSAQDYQSAQATKSYQNSLQTNYLNTVANAQTQMNTYINSIQASDIPVEAKTSQIAAAQSLYKNTVSTTKAAYENMPGWQSEWSLIPTA